MDFFSDTVVARVPFVVRCLDRQGQPVSLSAPTLGRSSTGLQDLLRRAYTEFRGPCPTETVTVTFLEDEDGRLHLEYLVVDRARLRRWRRRGRGRAEDVHAALGGASVVVTAAVEAVGGLAAVATAHWSDSDSPDFADLVLGGTHTQRVPRTVRAWLGDDAELDLLRGILAMFLDDDVEQLVIGKDPGRPGRYREAVVTRCPGLVDFVQGAPLASLAGPRPS